MSTVASSLLDNLKDVQVTSHQQDGPIEVFHLRWPGGGGVEYATLDEALGAKWIEVTEFTEAGEVPGIKIVNRSGHMVFVMAGEQLVGGKQNRVMNASMMVPSHSEMPLPVTCVEQGRWGYSSPVFSSGRSSSHQRLRTLMSQQVTMSYRRAGAPTADQRAVWREVSHTLGSTGSRSSSAALEDVFGNYEKKLAETLERFPAPTDCSGAVFVINGRIAGADLFDKPDTLRKLWPKLIKSCTIEALEPSAKPAGSLPPEAISRWLEAATSAKLESFPSPGLGRDVRIEGDDVVGASLLIGELPVHMELFPR